MSRLVIGNDSHFYFPLVDQGVDWDEVLSIISSVLSIIGAIAGIIIAFL